MKIRTIFLLFVLILMAVFLVINWTALSTVTAVNLIYTEIQAPLGVLVVGGFAAVVFVLLVYMVWQQASVTLELRAAYKEARNARTVADDAEKSRFAESNRILLERIEKLEALMTARSDETLTAVRQEAVRAEERYKALFDDQKRAQGELTAQVQTQIGAMEKRVVETLPSAVSAAVPTQALAEEAEKEKENPSAKKKIQSDTNRGIPQITDEQTGKELLERIRNVDFTVTEVSSKKGTEAPPRLFDLTSLQVECNKKFSYSADMTLQLIQSLYEKKVATYPRVDTTFLSDDIYPKCPKILEGLKDYAVYTTALSGKPLIKSKKVFDNSKVTDHHAIIPTGVQPQGLSDMEKRVFDLIARRFIAVFYPDCKFSTTTVIGEADQIEFKVTGKQILEPGWRVIFAKDVPEEGKENEEESVLPAFTKGESGPHSPMLNEKWTQPPRPYTEATLLRAMETAGKLVDNDELRDALKENGIGRPSTRAAIIETLFKRHYIRKERKNLIATPTGVELIQLIHEELLKSAELTGIWEKKLREIERKSYDAGTFLAELKQMVTEIVYSVLRDNSNRRVTVTTDDSPKIPLKKAAAPKNGEEEPKKKAAPRKPRASKKAATPEAPKEDNLPADDSILGKACPVCGTGIIIKGKTAYGCSQWKNGCKFRKPFKA